LGKWFENRISFAEAPENSLQISRYLYLSKAYFYVKFKRHQKVTLQSRMEEASFFVVPGVRHLRVTTPNPKPEKGATRE